MNFTPQQNKALQECAKLLKLAFGGLKRVVFDLGNERQDDRVHWEVHGKETVKTK